MLTLFALLGIVRLGPSRVARSTLNDITQSDHNIRLLLFFCRLCYGIFLL